MISAARAGPIAKPTLNALTSKRSSWTCWKGNTKNPVRVVGFNTAEKWSEDVSGAVAHELRRRCDLKFRDVPCYLQDFVDRYEGRYRDSQLLLPMRLGEPCTARGLRRSEPRRRLLTIGLAISRVATAC